MGLSTIKSSSCCGCLERMNDGVILIWWGIHFSLCKVIISNLSKEFLVCSAEY
jgi:hypothetical protein